MRTIFTGFTAYMGAFSSVSQGKMWWQDLATIRGAFDPSLMIAVDVAMSPSRVTPAQVQIDDFGMSPSARRTQIGGPSAGWAGWPEGVHAGVAYVSDDFRVANKMPAVPPDAAGQPYEFQSAWYWPGTGVPQAGTRYFGFYAQIIGQVTTDVPRSLIALYRAGTSTAATPTVERVLNWVDLTDTTMFDANVSAGGLTAIGGAVTTGALFVSESYASLLALDGPKRPKSAGE